METNLSKQVLTLDEASLYCGFTRRYLLKLISLRKLPAYKPNGKAIFIDRQELEAWLLTGRISSNDEIESEAMRRTIRRDGR